MERPPQINLESLIVKTLTEGEKTTYRHFFEWSERKTTDRLDVKVNLYAENGNTIATTKGFSLPKQKRNDVPIKRFFYVDAPAIAVGFGYSTSTLLGRPSQAEIKLITSKREDLSGL